MLVVALSLPLVGFVSLVQVDYERWHFTNPALHFVLFLTVGATAASLSLITGEAAQRRGDARVLLLSLAFLSTSGFMALHAVGTQGVLVQGSHPGFTIAISAGLLLAAVFALMAALVDVGPSVGPLVMRARRWLYGVVFAAFVGWTVWTLANWPPLNAPLGEGGVGTALEIAAALGAFTYTAAAARLWWVNRKQPSLLVISVGSCFILLAEALIGVAFGGETKWHSAWWMWHALIVTGYLIVFAAARREWRDERFRELYLPTTREHREEVSVLIGDLAGFTTFSEAHDPAEVAAMLRAYYEVAAPLISRRFGGEVEKFMGDGIFATFNRRGDQRGPRRNGPSAAASALQSGGGGDPVRPRRDGRASASGSTAGRRRHGDGREPDTSPTRRSATRSTSPPASRRRRPWAASSSGADTQRRLPAGTAVNPCPACGSRARRSRSTPIC